MASENQNSQRFIVIEKDGKKIMVTFDDSGVIDTIHELKTIRADQPIGKFLVNERNAAKLHNGEIPTISHGTIANTHSIVD